jgi:hypothetical protein
VGAKARHAGFAYMASWHRWRRITERENVRCSKERALPNQSGKVVFLFVSGKEFLDFFLFLAYSYIYVRFSLFSLHLSPTGSLSDESVKQRIYVVWF